MKSTDDERGGCASGPANRVAGAERGGAAERAGRPENERTSGDTRTSADERTSGDTRTSADAPATLAAHLIELETLLLQPSVRGSERVRELLADDFVEVGSSGHVYGKGDVAALLRAEPPVERTATEFTVRLLEPHTALVTYRADRRGAPPVQTLRSSIWQERDGHWRLIFHQGTAAADAAQAGRDGPTAAGVSGDAARGWPGKARAASDKDVGRFGRWAASYDRSRLQQIVFDPLHEVTLQEATAAIPEPHSILDIGCGTGLFLRKAAQRFPAADLTGVDAAEEMIQVAREAVPEGASMRFLQAFAEHLPFPDCSFDLVVTTMSFHHWADQAAALREVHRVLAPGGVFAVADALRVGWSMWVFARSGHGRFAKPAVLARLLADAGFVATRGVPLPKFGGTVQVVLTRREQVRTGPAAADRV